MMTHCYNKNQTKSKHASQKMITLPHMHPLSFFCPSSRYDPSGFTQKLGVPSHGTLAICKQPMLH